MEQGINVPILFAKVGWMEFYSGPRPGDLKPMGGGRYTKEDFGLRGSISDATAINFSGLLVRPLNAGDLTSNESIHLRWAAALGVRR